MLEVHFLNVGHGDCIVIQHPSGRITVIDINNGTDLDTISQQELQAAYGVVPRNPFLVPYAPPGRPRSLREAGYDVSLTNPIEFLRRRYPGHNIFRFIQTHPDLDHMRGLSTFGGAGIQVLNFWDTDHTKTVTDFQSEADRVEWNAYLGLRSGAGVTVLRLHRGDTGAYWSQDPLGVNGGDGIEILSPTRDIAAAANAEEKYNNLSYVLRLTCNGISMILGGDADADVWEAIARHYGRNLKCDLLKASHHGRDSGYHADAVRLMNPQYTIVSVGKKPETDASNKYRQYSQNVWSTRWRGNISVTVDGNGRGTINSQYGD